MSVDTAGVDLSAEDAKTCFARVAWSKGAALVVDLQQRVSNVDIIDAAPGLSKLGIDCPFGWPSPFVDFVVAHGRGELVPPDGQPLEWRRRLANRTTDLALRAETGLVPLSVSADRIAHVAMRCAALLAELVTAGVSVDRSGLTGTVVEVYPSASLFRWGLGHRGYKSAARSTKLNELVDQLLRIAPWLSLGPYDAACRASDDAFDAVIAAMSARAAAIGQTLRPTAEQASSARREGWIALPFQGSLSDLAGAADHS